MTDEEVLGGDEGWLSIIRMLGKFRVSWGSCGFSEPNWLIDKGDSVVVDEVVGIRELVMSSCIDPRRLSCTALTDRGDIIAEI